MTTAGHHHVDDKILMGLRELNYTWTNYECAISTTKREEEEKRTKADALKHLFLAFSRIICSVWRREGVAVKNVTPRTICQSVRKGCHQFQIEWRGIFSSFSHIYNSRNFLLSMSSSVILHFSSRHFRKYLRSTFCIPRIIESPTHRIHIRWNVVRYQFWRCCEGTIFPFPVGKCLTFSSSIPGAFACCSGTAGAALRGSIEWKELQTWIESLRVSNRWSWEINWPNSGTNESQLFHCQVDVLPPHFAVELNDRLSQISPLR